MKIYKIFYISIMVLKITIFHKALSNDIIQTTNSIEKIDVYDLKTKSALIFGITGQDGAYLTQFLLNKGYKVYGVVRRTSSSSNLQKLSHILKNEPNEIKKNLTLLYGDITDVSLVFKIINKVKPNEIYNLAAQSHVQISFEKPAYTAQVDAIGTLNILESIINADLTNKTKFYQASTSELFGKVQQIPQDEKTMFYPRSPYGVAKLYAYWITVNYRESYDAFVCNGILFNHESPYRGDNFVTKIITDGVVRIKLGLQDKITLGNLNSKRDWGFAGDYVEAMWLMLQQDVPEDFVIATGETHSVKEFVEIAFKEINIEIEWKGEGINEVGIDKETKKILVSIDPKYFRPTEVDLLIGNPKKAETKLNWKRKVNFENLVKLMIKNTVPKKLKFYLNIQC